MEVVLDLEFEQAVFGAEVSVDLRLPQRCDDCAGTGAGEGTQPVTCADCNGAGQVRRVRQSMLGQMMTTSACPRCSGLGEVIATRVADVVERAASLLSAPTKLRCQRVLILGQRCG